MNGMDGMSGMGSGGDMGFTPLSADGVDFGNETQAFNFLQEILDDTYFQVESNAYARYFWYAVVSTIAVVAIFNQLQRLLLKHSNKLPGLVTTPFNTMTAIVRECTTLQLTPNATSSWFRIPPLGSIFLVLSYFGLIAVLEFLDNDYPGAQHYQAYGLRAAWLAVAQVPLIVLLAGKNNLIGFLTGMNYQGLNVLHRWVARGLLVLATMHFGFQSTGWSKYGLMQLEWRTDTCPPTGIAAYAILLWINIVNLSPTRRLSYPFFVAQHILMFFGFIIALMIHLPSTALYSRVYIWIAIGLYLFDRCVRTLWTAWKNRSLSEARLENLDGVATRITITNKAIKNWTAGSHVLLCIPRFGFLQTHPATIVSTPMSHNGDLVFILKAHKNFTRSLLKSALKSQQRAPNSQDKEALVSHRCITDGPYSSSLLDLSCFEVVAFVAGGTGVTFTLAGLLDLADRAKANKRVPNFIAFTWVIKQKSHLNWVKAELDSALQTLKSHGCQVVCTIHATREHNDKAGENLAAGKTIGSYSDVKETRESLKGESSADSDTDQELKEAGLITVYYGRPELSTVLSASIEKASDGETAIVACGPLQLTKTVRNEYTRICDDRAVCKGSGTKGVYLHVENRYN